MRPLVLFGAALTLGLATPALAQDEGSIDLGAYLRATKAEENVTNDLLLGYGGRFGIFLRRNVALELEVSNNETAKDAYVLVRPLSARLAWHFPLTQKWTGIVGGGLVRQFIDPANAANTRDLWSDDGWTALLGVERQLRGRMSLRIDGVLEQYHTPINESPTNDLDDTQLALQVGLNWRFRNGDEPAAAPVPPPMPAVPVDSDRDGVPDSADACANTPAGTRVDARGCAVPVDSDGDGVMDNVDACVNTPAGTRVDARGCAVPVDSDGDGVMDNADRCANTPAGTRVDGNGCPVPVDTDGDGVMDNVDACPNTARGTAVDARGCARIFEEGRTTIVLEGVTFNTGSAVLTDAAKVVLDKMAETLNGAPDVNVEVQGHTDNTGSAAVNTRLSGQRAESVRAYLVSRGVAAARLTAKGYGPTVPVADNGTAAGRAQNRRVELKRTN